MQQSSIHYTLLYIHSSHDTTLTVWKLFTKKNKCFTDFRIATTPHTSVSKDVGDSSIRRMNSTQSALLAARKLCLDTDLSHDVSRSVAVTSHRVPSRVTLQLRPACGRANSNKATICLCDVSPEYRLTGRSSVIPTARRLDHGRAATHVCTPYQCRGNSQ